MRPTRLGVGVFLLSGLTWLTAASTGNNLLYLLFSVMIAALLASVVLGRLNLSGLTASAVAPEQAFRGSPFSLRIFLINGSRRAAFWVRLSGAGEKTFAPEVPPGGRAALEVRVTLPHRGVNALEGLFAQSSFPFGLILHRRALTGAAVITLPRLREIRAAADTTADARPSGKATLKKGSGDELYGVRESSPEDDARLINWKLSARLGRAVVNEYAEAHDSKVTVRVSGAFGPGAERRIEEAASACRFFIDAGASVRLVTPEEDLSHGRGLLHLDRMLRSLALLGDGKNPRPAPLAVAGAAAAVQDSPALRRLTWALTIIVYAGMYLIDEVSVPLLAGLAPVLLLGLAAQEKRFNILPDGVWSALSCLVLAYAILVDWRTAGVIVANTHLLVYLLANRSLIPYKAHEFPQIFCILFLAFFLTSGLTISLSYFPVFLGYAVLGGAWLALCAGAPGASWRRWAPALGARLATALILAVLLFTALPRVEGMRRFNPFLAAGIDKLSLRNSPLTGFSEGVSLGFFGELKRSSARVMRLTPPQAPPSGGRAPAVRIRGLAYDTFDGRRWRLEPLLFRYRMPDGRWSRGDRAWARRQGDRLLFPAPALKGGEPWDFWIYPAGLSVLFTVGSPWLISGAAEDASFDHADGLRSASPYIGGARYKLYPAASLGYEGAIKDYDALLKERYLRLPPDRFGRLEPLAREITAGAVGAEAKARAVEEHLRRMDYSTFMDAKDFSLEHFLFKSKKGNCEYFASAAAVLLRHAGVPTRLVTGFLASEWNQYGRFYDVRQSEAHAWVEAYVPGKGWITVEATPPQGLLSMRGEAVLRRLEKWFDAVQTQWYRQVIGYDQYAQSNTFKRLGAALNPNLLGRLADVSLRGALLVAVALLLNSFVRWAVRRFKAAPPGYFPRAQAILEKGGLKREPFWTAREYARWVGERKPEFSVLSELAELHYRENFGGRPLSAEERYRAEAILSEIRTRV